MMYAASIGNSLPMKIRTCRNGAPQKWIAAHGVLLKSARSVSNASTVAFHKVLSLVSMRLPLPLVSMPARLARVFGNILDEESPVAKALKEQETFRLREEWGTQPKVHYVRPTSERS